MAATRRPRRRGLSSIVRSNGLLQAFGLDALGALGLIAIGVTVYRIAPAAIWAYAGALLLVLWWSIGQDRAARAAEKKG